MDINYPWWTNVHTWMIVNVWAVQQGPPTDSGGLIKPQWLNCRILKRKHWQGGQQPTRPY